MGEVSFEVLNAGGTAFSTAHALVNIELKLVEYNPDIILLMHNINDASVNSFLKGATSDYSNKYLQPYFLNPQLQGSLSFTGFLMQFILLTKLLTKLGLQHLLEYERPEVNVNNDYKYGIHLFKRNLAAIASICKLHDIDLVLLSQPHSMEPHPYTTIEEFLAYNEAISEVATEKSVYFIDLFSQMGHEKKWYSDEIHYSPEGIDRFSKILYSELDRIILQRLKHNE